MGDDYASQSSQSSISKKHKQNEVVLSDGIHIERDEGPTGLSITEEKVVTGGNKGKSKIDCDETWQNQAQVALANDVRNPTSEAGSEDSPDPLKSFASGSSDLININGFNSDLSYHDDDAIDDDDDDDVSGYDDNDDFLYDDDYLKLQAQFDNVDIPPGVEASVPWLKDPTPSEKMPAVVDTSPTPSLQGQCAPVGSFSDPGEKETKKAATSSSTVPAQSGDGNQDDVLGKYLFFKRFDTVEDFSDHHFSRMGFVGEQPPKNWAKKIQEEWKILERDLPETIFVRVYEARMDLLRAVIVGPAGTPYHDGLFVFDVLFPPNYPSVPPMVYYYSGGLRLNPNLYDCGKVCLSLLNTWNGKKTEMWIPGKSTMLQVLVSIQGLILNAKPFFNEPGYENMYVGEDGERRSKQYNEDVFILSLKTMVYTIRRPPKHFEDFVVGHFRQRAHDILVACKAYKEGSQVGSMVKEGTQDVNEHEMSTSHEFKEAVGKMMKTLVTNFIKNGSKDCEQFQVSA
ncbi:putative ubiquitin-conjugating enzyme E2 38 [Vitis riparia]|uniref:putative ubiquitin-conjugating enzyme E2 38 n=1 Tax=Vitis riparia TaxID=96939 RepID=UPI00155AC629|nr:putative ubiquitin-conjugating enzyme E2 38 [Vitis riparia]